MAGTASYEVAIYKANNQRCFGVTGSSADIDYSLTQWATCHLYGWWSPSIPPSY